MDLSKILADAGVDSDVAERVLRGNALLDEKLPEDWFQHADDVIINNMNYCVLGQLGNFYDGKLDGFEVYCVAGYRQPYGAMLRWMSGEGYVLPGSFGFYASDDACNRDRHYEDMADLAAAWNILLEARRTISQ